MSYIQGGYTDDSWDQDPKKGKDPKKDDDPASKNPTGNKRRSSAGKRRQNDNKLFRGTPWGKKKDDDKK